MSQSSSFVFLGKSGCLLPSLILFNLLFGRIFLAPRAWLIVEALLVLLFLVNSYFLVNKVTRIVKDTAHSNRRNSSAIDVEGEIVDEKKGQKI